MSNMKILCVGDPHIKESSVVETEVLVLAIIKAINEHDPEVVVIMGDTLHNHERINCTIQVIATRFFERILEALSKKSKLYVLIGNHDICDPHSFLTEYHAFYSLKNKNYRMKIIDKPTIDNISGYNLMFVPFVPNGRFKEACETVTTTEEIVENVATIFCHQELTGAKIENFVSDVEDFPAEMPLCVAGHIHKYHVVSDNLIYVGTPYQHRFGEDTDKALLLLNYSEEDITPTRIRLENIPLKIKMIISKDEFEKLDELSESDNYKIEIYGYSEEIQALKLSEKHMKLKKMSNVKLLYSILDDKSAPKTEKPTVLVPFRKRLEEILGDNTKKLEIHDTICKKIY